LAAAQREVHEETGYSFNNWRLVQVIQPYRKMEWFVYTWLAWDASGQDDSHIDAGEKISAQLLDFETLKGKITARQGYLAELQGLFQFLENVSDLQKLPEFSGQEVDR
jgi:ADP-ribose pyrophosphatase YjhB (NUDIX family)